MAENKPTETASEYFKAGSASATRAVLQGTGKPQGIDVLTAHAVFALPKGWSN
jgi:hypothetical protein